MKGFIKNSIMICCFLLAFLFLASQSQCQYSFHYSPYYYTSWQQQYDQLYGSFSNNFTWDIKTDYRWNIKDNYFLEDTLQDNVFNYANTYYFKWKGFPEYCSSTGMSINTLNFISEINYGDIVIPYYENQYSGYFDVFNYQFYFLDFYQNLFYPQSKSSSSKIIPTSITIDPNNILFSYLGQTQQLTLTATYSDTTIKTLTSSKAGITYISSDPNIAIVDNSGLVTALKNGTAIVTVSYKDLSDNIEVVVSIIQEVKIQKLQASSKYVKKNDQITIECLALNAHPDTILTYQWEINGEIIPETNNADIILTVPTSIPSSATSLDSNIYTICCTISDNHGGEDYSCIKIPIIRSSINPPFIAISNYKSGLFTIKSGEEFILTEPELMVINPEKIPFFYFCNVGTITEIDEDVLLYSFQPSNPGWYSIQIYAYNLESTIGIGTEFMLMVLPWWVLPESNNAHSTN